MSPEVHHKLDATINDLKGKPDTVNKRLRYKLDSSAVRASADGAAAIAGKIADGVACKNPHRLFRPSKTHEKQHKAHGASPVSHSQLGLGATGAGALASWDRFSHPNIWDLRPELSLSIRQAGPVDEEGVRSVAVWTL